MAGGGGAIVCTCSGRCAMATTTAPGPCHVQIAGAGATRSVRLVRRCACSLTFAAPVAPTRTTAQHERASASAPAPLPTSAAPRAKRPSDDVVARQTLTLLDCTHGCIQGIRRLAASASLLAACGRSYPASAASDRRSVTCRASSIRTPSLEKGAVDALNRRGRWSASSGFA